MEKSYRYLGYFFLVIIPLVILAFWPTYLVQFPNFNNRNDVYAHLHGIISVVWMSLLIAQPFLIASKNYRLHRKLGGMSYYIFPLLLLSIMPQTMKSFSSNLVGVFFPIADSIVMTALYLLAISFRKNPAKHMRYMIAMTLIIFGPTFGRIGPIFLGLNEIATQVIMYGIIFSILISLFIYDYLNRGDYRPYIHAMPIYATHALIFFTIFL